MECLLKVVQQWVPTDRNIQCLNGVSNPDLLHSMGVSKLLDHQRELSVHSLPSGESVSSHFDQTNNRSIDPILGAK